MQINSVLSAVNFQSLLGQPIFQNRARTKFFQIITSAQIKLQINSNQAIGCQCFDGLPTAYCLYLAIFFKALKLSSCRSIW